jgi:hypothetical protein
MGTAVGLATGVLIGRGVVATLLPIGERGAGVSALADGVAAVSTFVTACPLPSSEFPHALAPSTALNDKT